MLVFKLTSICFYFNYSCSCKCGLNLHFLTDEVEHLIIASLPLIVFLGDTSDQMVSIFHRKSSHCSVLSILLMSQKLFTRDLICKYALPGVWLDFHSPSSVSNQREADAEVQPVMGSLVDCALALMSTNTSPNPETIHFSSRSFSDFHFV